jgi:transposase InsO family protein
MLTTDSDHPFPRYPNLVAGLAMARPDYVWVADITYVRVRAEFVYLAVLLDVFIRAEFVYLATMAHLQAPFGVAFDRAGNL